MYKEVFNIDAFETISESSENQLVGGFSTSVSSNTAMTFAGDTNNCLGGNCIEGCGSGQNAVSCNSYAGCGKY